MAGIIRLVGAASLPEGARDTAAWCCRQLPGLYDQFCRDCESRYVDEILRLEQALLRAFTESRDQPAHAQAAGPRTLILDELRLLHEHFGRPALNLTLPRAPAPRSRKAG